VKPDIDLNLEKAKHRIGTVNRVASFNSNLYTFYYRSKSGTDSNPLVMLLQSKKTGNAFYPTKAGHRMMLGINLNYVSGEGVKAKIVDTFSSKGPIPWKTAVMLGRLFTKLGKNVLSEFIRQYDVRKLRDLSVVSPTKYLEGLGYNNQDPRN
tara:strand:+ start:19334 stop:19789 length:456 start_codon:yes stop_codon:yes gene_type:complete